MTSSASSAGLSSEHRHEQDLAGFETTQDLTSTGQSQVSSAGPQASFQTTSAAGSHHLGGPHRPCVAYKLRLIKAFGQDWCSEADMNITDELATSIPAMSLPVRQRLVSLDLHSVLGSMPNEAICAFAS